MEKNDIITAQAVAFGTNGEGIVKWEGGTVFVPFLIPGEKARIRILKVKNNIAYGKAEEVLTPAEERVRPACKAFFRCGGCQLQHLRYSAQLKFKTELVRDTLRKIAGICFDVPLCERSDAKYGYRNKLQLPVGRKDGKNAIGFYAERSHRIVETDECPIHPDWAKALIKALSDYMERCGLTGYDEGTGKGDIRHVVVRELKGKFIVVLVVTREPKGLDTFLSLLDGVFSEYSLLLNFNIKPTNAVFGDRFERIRGKGFYSCTECGISYEAGAATFVQVNEGVRAKLYERVVSFFKEGETVIDCYAGGGLLTAMLAKKCGRAIGVEIVPEASACADKLKESNGLSEKMTNVCGKVEDCLAEILADSPNASVVLDPPRAGAERSVLRELIKRSVKKIVMVSCNPATLARDVGILTGSLCESETGELIKTDAPSGGYRLEYVQPFDMFAQTKHVETLVVLSKKIPDSHINIDVEFGENEGQFSLKKIKERVEERKPKDKVTYKMIHEYIEQTYGFKVHTAYIAEVKRELGLPMYDAPNAVEELKKTRAHPTPRMVEAIKETLKYFEII